MNSVELIGFYGSDITHALSAWTSTSRELTEEKIKRVPALLNMLAENQHHTPFEKSCLHFLIHCDIASHIHLLKHRIGVSVNAESARYKELKSDRFYVPADWPEHLQETLRQRSQENINLYHLILSELVSRGMSRKRAKESARYFLGYGTIITSDVAFNFRSFMHFQKLRNEQHAQQEIRTIAEQMLEEVWKTGAFDRSLEAYGFRRGR